LRPWDKVKFDPAKHRAKPEPYFFIFSLPAAELRSLELHPVPKTPS
jgi:hypothetical protein